MWTILLWGWHWRFSWGKVISIAFLEQHYFDTNDCMWHKDTLQQVPYLGQMFIGAWHGTLHLSSLQTLVDSLSPATLPKPSAHKNMAFFSISIRVRPTNKAWARSGNSFHGELGLWQFFLTESQYFMLYLYFSTFIQNESFKNTQSLLFAIRMYYHGPEQTIFVCFFDASASSFLPLCWSTTCSHGAQWSR